MHPYILIVSFSLFLRRHMYTNSFVILSVFGLFFFVFTQRCLFNFNAALLITGPVILLVLNRAPDCMFKSIPATLRTAVDSSNLSTCIWRCLKFWVALLFAALAQALLAYGSLALNPFVSYLFLPSMYMLT